MIRTCVCVDFYDYDFYTHTHTHTLHSRAEQVERANDIGYLHVNARFCCCCCCCCFVLG